jgi:hypothetical protein
MQEKKPKRGGARPGAGLKPGTILVPPERRARKVNVSIRYELYEKLAADAEKQDATISLTIIKALEKKYLKNSAKIEKKC